MSLYEYNDFNDFNDYSTESSSYYPYYGGEYYLENPTLEGYLMEDADFTMESAALMYWLTENDFNAMEAYNSAESDYIRNEIIHVYESSITETLGKWWDKLMEKIKTFFNWLRGLWNRAFGKKVEDVKKDVDSAKEVLAKTKDAPSNKEYHVSQDEKGHIYVEVTETKDKSGKVTKNKSIKVSTMSTKGGKGVGVMNRGVVSYDLRKPYPAADTDFVKWAGRGDLKADSISEWQDKSKPDLLIKHFITVFKSSVSPMVVDGDYAKTLDNISKNLKEYTDAKNKIPNDEKEVLNNAKILKDRLNNLILKDSEFNVHSSYVKLSDSAKAKGGFNMQGLSEKEISKKAKESKFKSRDEINVAVLYFRRVKTYFHLKSEILANLIRGCGIIASQVDRAKRNSEFEQKSDKEQATIRKIELNRNYNKSKIDASAKKAWDEGKAKAEKDLEKRKIANLPNRYQYDTYADYMARSPERTYNSHYDNTDNK